MSKKVYNVITNIFIKALEENTVPWKQPWTTTGLARGWKGNEYRGVNALIVTLSGRPGPFATKRQIAAAGGTVNKGECYIPIVFWKFLKDKENPDKRIPLIRFYQVYCIQTQCTGVTLPKWAQKVKDAQDSATNDHTGTTPVQAFNDILAGFKNAPPVEYGYDHSAYLPYRDRVELPDMNAFDCPESFASVGFHELIHSTGHEKRLKRFQKDDGPAMFGSTSYSKEELVAEIGSAMLLAKCGIEHKATTENSKAYVKNWLRRLKDDPSLIVWAAGRAQKACDLITGYVYEKPEADD